MTVSSSLAGIRGVILDLDGVVYRGDQLLPAANDFLAYLAATGRRVVALTNHSGRTAAEYAQKLAGLGVTLPATDILSAGWATATYLRRERPGKTVFVVGSDALRRELDEQEVLRFDRPDIVVVGFVPEVEQATLTTAVRHLIGGSELIATNPDALLPVRGGVIPECGPVTAYLEAASGTRAVVIGKPNPWIVDLALERLRVDRSETLIVGDTLATDIAAAHASNVRAALVLTGNTTIAPQMDGLVVAEDLAGLMRAFGRA